MSSFAPVRSNRMVMSMAHSFDGHAHVSSVLWHMEESEDSPERRSPLQAGKRQQRTIQDPSAMLSSSLSKMDGQKRASPTARPNTASSPAFYELSAFSMDHQSSRSKLARASQSLPQLPTMTTPAPADAWASSSEDLSNGDVSTAPTSPVSTCHTKDDLGSLPMFPALNQKSEPVARMSPGNGNAKGEMNLDYQEFVPAAGEGSDDDKDADGDSEEEDSEDGSDWETDSIEESDDEGVFEYHGEEMSIVFGFSDDEDQDEDDCEDSEEETSDEEDDAAYSSDEDDVFARSFQQSSLPSLIGSPLPHRRPRPPLTSCLSTNCTTSTAPKPGQKPPMPRSVRFSETAERPTIIRTRTWTIASYEFEQFLNSSDCPDDIRSTYCSQQTEMERMMALEDVKRHLAETLGFGQEERERFCRNNYNLGKVEFEQLSKMMAEEEAERRAERKVEGQWKEDRGVGEAGCRMAKKAYVSEEGEEEGWITETEDSA